MKISSGVNLNSITYSNELKTQNESQKMETYNNTDIVNISKEGVSKWQEYLSKKNDSLYQMEESGAVELDSTGADVWSQELSMQRSKSLQEIREKGMQYGFEDIMFASLGAYASLYEKINEGYENGTREVWVADEKMGKRKLSKEEEIDRLNNAYKREIEWQTMVMNSRKETEKARNITVFGNQINIDAANDKDDSDKLFELMDDMKDEYLLCRKNEDYNKNIQGVSNIVSSILSRFDLKNHMINIFEGISLSK